MANKPSFKLKILLFQEDNKWIAQGISHNIVAQGNFVYAALEAFDKSFTGQVYLDLAAGNKPLKSLPKVDKKYVDIFNHKDSLTVQDPNLFKDSSYKISTLEIKIHKPGFSDTTKMGNLVKNISVTARKKKEK